jgi:type II secretory pathway pseudopilin PulG
MGRAKGFTLLEIIVAFILLLMLLFSLGVLIPLAQVRVKNTANRDVAMTLADNMLERIRAIKFDEVRAALYEGDKISPDPAANDGVNSPDRYPPLPYPTTTTYQSYPSAETMRIMAHQVDYFFNVDVKLDNNNPDLKTVSVSVIWREAGRSDKAGIKVSTKIFRTP